MTSQCRHNFQAECEAGINKHVNMELYASYVYQCMAFYFDRDDIALPGVHKYLMKSSKEKRSCAEKLMEYQNLRGGRIVLQEVVKPDWTDGTALVAMENILAVEKQVNQGLLDLHKVASTNGDSQMCHFLQNEFLDGQVKRMKEIADHIANLKRVGTGLGEYVFDKETLHGE